jgi:VWFA-related protein
VRGSLSFTLALLFCYPGSECGRASAQQSAAVQPPPPTVQVNVNRVLVPVVVRDKQGHAVAGLKKEDFQVFDDDRPRAVSSFEVESRHQAEEVPAAGVGVAAAPDAAALGPGGQRFIVFLFDDLHLSVDDLPQAQKAAAKALNAGLNGIDLAGVVSTSGKMNTGFTRDIAKLQQGIMGVRPRLVYRSSTSDCPYLSYYQADLMENHRDGGALGDAVRQVLNCSPGLDPQRDFDEAERLAHSAAREALNLGNQDIRATYFAISTYVRGMAKLPGERTLILVSPGFQPVEEVARTEESRLLDLAAQSNVTISALDARGVYNTEATASLGPQASTPYQADVRRAAMRVAEEAMGELADGTGGTFIHNSNDLEAGFKRLAQGPQVVYVLELPLEDIKPNGTYHGLKVKVNREGLDVQARRGYFVPKPEKKKK